MFNFKKNQEKEKEKIKKIILKKIEKTRKTFDKKVKKLKLNKIEAEKIYLSVFDNYGKICGEVLRSLTKK